MYGGIVGTNGIEYIVDSRGCLSNAGITGSGGSIVVYITHGCRLFMEADGVGDNALG